MKAPEYQIETNHLSGQVALKRRGLDGVYRECCSIGTRTDEEALAIRAGKIDPGEANRRMDQIATQLDDLLLEVGIVTAAMSHLS